MRMIFATFLLALFLAFGNCLGQPASEESEISKHLSISGELGGFTEIYRISGRAPRRPNETGRLFLRPDIRVFGSIDLSFRAMLSTEGNSSRQDINQLGLTPKWRWGQAYLGDFSENYSSLTVNGIRIRGTGFDIYPGLVRFSSFIGNAKRAVFGGAADGSFKRQIRAARIGVGRESSSYFDLIALYGRDDVGSLPPPDTTDIDTTEIGTMAGLYSVTPQENLLLAAATKLRLLQKKLVFNAEFSGSAHSRDRRADVLDDEELLSKIPDFLENILTPRTSSHIDYAYMTSLELRLARFSFKLAHNYLGPGYVSLGLYSLLVDKKEFSFNTRLRMKKWSLLLRGSRQNDNLIDQKRFTTVRYRIGGNLNLRVRRNWRSSLLGNFLNMNNDAPAGMNTVSYSNWLLGTTQTWMIAQEGFWRNASFNYLLHTTVAKLDRSDSWSHSITVRVDTRPAEKLSVAPSLGLVRSKIGIRPSNFTTTYAIASRYHALKNKWLTSLSLGTTVVNATKTFQLALTSSYRLSNKDQLKITIHNTNFRGGMRRLPDYDERRASLSLVHKL